MTIVATAALQADLTPDQIVERLRHGNDRFAAGETVGHDLLAQARATADGQYPLAAVLGCIDSRVPVEAVFDAGIGDLFVARSAGNVVDDDVLGGLEFATELAGAKVIVVLGHTGCGAVKGACADAELGNLTQLLAKIKPAVVAERNPHGDADGADFVRRVVDRNVANMVDALRDRSAVLAAREQAGDLLLVGATYELATGVVNWPVG